MTEEEVARLVEERMLGKQHGSFAFDGEGRLIGVWQRDKFSGELRIVTNGSVQVSANHFRSVHLDLMK